MNVLALDPGGTTGCAARLHNGSWFTQHVGSPQGLWQVLAGIDIDMPSQDKLKRLVLGEQMEVLTRLREALRDAPRKWDLVGYERFASSVATSQPAIYTMELCGSIEAICWAMGIPCKRFEPANRTAWLEEAAAMVKGRRKEQGQPFGPLIVHEIDAMAHLLRYEAIGWDAAPKHGKWGTGLRGGGTGPGIMQHSRGVVLS